MKTLFFLLAIIIISTLAVPNHGAEAQQRSPATTPLTTWLFSYSVGGVSHNASFPTPAGKRILLPVAFDQWNCKIHDVSLSDDGLKTFHNVTCDQVDSPFAVGMSVNCPINSEGSDTETFFLVSGALRVEFAGSCQTFRVTQPRPRPAPTPEVKNL